jgi:guanylate kinase
MAIFLVGPSAVGKSTLKARLLRDYPNKFEESISCTTRSPRAGETDGLDYYFISEVEFQSRIDAGDFLEWEHVHGQRYGTLKTEIARILTNKKIPLFDIDLKGAENLLKILNEPESNIIFILPDNIQALEERIRRRASESEAQIRARLDHAIWEISQASRFKNHVINTDLEIAYQDLCRILGLLK